MRSIVCLYDNTRYRVASAFVTHGAFYTWYDDVIRITLVTLVTLGRVAAKQRSGVLQGLRGSSTYTSSLFLLKFGG